MLGTAGVVVAIGLVGVGFFFMLKKSDDPAKMFFKVAFTIPFVTFCIWLGVKLGPAGPFLIVIMGVVLSFMWTPHLGELIASPIANLFDGGAERPEPKPYYSIAQTKRMLQKPLEAVAEIRKQLAKFPTDFEGISLLASIQAEDLKDLASAEVTFNNFCAPPDAPPKQVAAALTQLADWHLELAQDSDSARLSLEKIIARYPETELALAAAQRIAHLGGTEKILLAPHDRRNVIVPEGERNIGLLDSTKHLIPEEADPATLAMEYVKHLEQHPLDAEIREKLAVLYADHYQRLDMAAAELNQLIEAPNQPAKRVAHWGNLLADLQVRHGAEYETVKQTLEKIIARFAGLPAAEMAQSRLARLKLEIKGQKETPGKKLGVYEQNIGLKYGSPYRSPHQL